MVVAVIAPYGWTASAIADGGKSIDSAPAIIYGQQEFGNDANGAQNIDQVYDSWWTLNVAAGDHITINWEAQLDPQGRGPALLIYAVGTTDYSVGNANPTTYQFLNSNGKNQLRYTAAVDGVMPVDFQADGNINLTYEEYPPGPYDFTAYVQHALVVSLSVTNVNRRKHRTMFVVGVHNPDGAAITNPNLRYDVQHRAGGSWRTTSTLGPPFAFSYRWPRGQRGKWQYVRVQVHGPGYVTATSRTVRVKGV